MSDIPARRLMGGSPVGVLARLVLVSLLVGALMSWLEIDLSALVDWLRISLERLWASGFRSMHLIGRYIATGAAVVLPLWLVLRLSSLGYRDRGSPHAGRWPLPGAPEGRSDPQTVRSGPRD